MSLTPCSAAIRTTVSAPFLISLSERHRYMLPVNRRRKRENKRRRAVQSLPDIVTLPGVTLKAAAYILRTPHAHTARTAHSVNIRIPVTLAPRKPYTLTVKHSKPSRGGKRAQVPSDNGELYSLCLSVHILHPFSLKSVSPHCQSMPRALIRRFTHACIKDTRSGIHKNYAFCGLIIALRCGIILLSHFQGGTLMDAVRGVCAFILDNPIWFLIPLALLNLLSFSLYGIDKLRAKRGMWRIPEATLLWSAALSGALGAFLFGMSLSRHKTKTRGVHRRRDAFACRSGACLRRGYLLRSLTLDSTHSPGGRAFTCFLFWERK